MSIQSPLLLVTSNNAIMLAGNVRSSDTDYRHVSPSDIGGHRKSF